MIELIYDTETTGKKPATSRLVQLAFRLVRGDHVLWGVNLYVNPGVPVPDDTAKFHGITTELVQEVGVLPETACAMFSQAAKIADHTVAHNLDYDRQIMEGEFKRLGKVSPAAAKPQWCTMKTATNLLKLPGKFNKPKWPSLAEAYEGLVSSEGFEGAHDAMVDVDACWAVLKALRAANVELLPYTAKV